MKKLIIIILLATSFTSHAQTGTQSEGRKNYLSVEVDPAPFILGGYSFSLKYSPAKFRHLSIMGSVYSSHFPDKMISKPNYEKGFRDLKIETSFAFFADYYLKSNNTGLHFGPSVFYYSRTAQLENSGDRAAFKSIYPNVRIGYVFKPFKKAGFYINPWINVGKEMGLGKRNHLSGAEYTFSKISYVPAIHLGYKTEF